MSRLTDPFPVHNNLNEILFVKDAESTKDDNSNDGGKGEEVESRSSTPAQQDDKEENKQEWLEFI